MAQVYQSLLWSKDRIYIELCSDYLYLLFFRHSLFHENPICDPMLTETTLTKIHTKYHERKASFILSWPPQNLSMSHCVTLILTLHYFQSSVDIRPSIDIHSSIYHNSTVFLRVCVVPQIYRLPQILFSLHSLTQIILPICSLPYIVSPRCYSVAK